MHHGHTLVLINSWLVVGQDPLVLLAILVCKQLVVHGSKGLQNLRSLDSAWDPIQILLSL